MLSTALQIALIAGSSIFTRPDSANHRADGDSLKWNLLIPDTATMARAWQVPYDPTNETKNLDPQQSKAILRGFRLFMNTPKASSRFTGGTMSCNNCHPNGGQRERALPLVGVDLA